MLQAIAWGNMVREYSTEVPFTQAVEMTLSGRYPCAICKAIAEKQNSENAKLATLEKHEKIFMARYRIKARVSLTSPQLFIELSYSWHTRSDAPPVPPPRCA